MPEPTDQKPVLPPDELVTAWIKEHGTLFCFSHMGIAFVFKPLSRREYRWLMAEDDQDKRTEDLVATCVLWPTEYRVQDQDLAGIADTLAAQILARSGFAGDPKQLIKDYRERIDSDLEAQMEAIVEYAFGRDGTFSKYQEWSIDQLVDGYQRAIWVLKMHREILAGSDPQIQDVDAPKQPAAGPRGRREFSKKVDEVASGGNPHELPFSEMQRRHERAQKMQRIREATKSSR